MKNVFVLIKWRIKMAMSKEVEKYFIEYLQIKNHLRIDNFWYREKKVNLKNVKKYQYNIVKGMCRTMKFKTFQKYLLVNFFFNEKFSIYKKEIDKTFTDAYLIYHDNQEYYYKKDIRTIKKILDEKKIKINYDVLYNLYEEKKIFFFTIIRVYKKFKDKLKFKNEKDKLKLDKYIYLENIIKESKII